MRDRPGPAIWQWPGLLLILAAAAWLHAGALRASFFSDDYLFLDQARDRSFVATLTSRDPIGNYFRPVSRQLWFWAVGSMGGESPALFHALNLALLLSAITLLFFIARRLIGPGGALIAAALVAVHHAADVPVLWVSGAQDLLAVVFALTAILLFQSSRTWWAAIAFLLALLSKEVVAFTPAIAALAARRRGETVAGGFRRAWPLGFVLAVWAVAFVVTRDRAGGAATSALGLSSAAATLVHVVQTLFGAEWSHAGPGTWIQTAPPAALLLIAIVPGLALFQKKEAPTTSRGAAAATGAAWLVLAALPLIPVASMWSAYYYLFAMCGAGLLLGALAASRPLIGWVLVLALGWTSDSARHLSEFASAPGAWTRQSHVNQRYLERGMEAQARYLSQIREQRPTLPPSTTVFFTGMPTQIGFQTADGPLLRWAYRDSSLRSHFLSEFRRERVRSGPTLFYEVRNNRLDPIVGPDSLERLGFAMVLSGGLEAARDLLTLELERDPTDLATAYRAAWLEMALGRPEVARAWLERSGMNPNPGPAPEVAVALDRVAAGDTPSATRLAQAAVANHALDAGAHGLLADLLLANPASDAMTIENAMIEAFAARVLAPDHPLSWRRWGLVAAVRGRGSEARAALEHYLAIGGPDAAADSVAMSVLQSMRRETAGGDSTQAGLRR